LKVKYREVMHKKQKRRELHSLYTKSMKTL